MPAENAHITLASHDAHFACFLSHKPEFHDWTATAAFYAAVHVVEALFACDDRHGHSHERREGMLKRDPAFNPLFRHYAPLLHTSLLARYLEGRRHSGRVQSSFAEYLSPNEVSEVMLRKHLVGVGQAAIELQRLSRDSTAAVERMIAELKNDTFRDPTPPGRRLPKRPLDGQ